MKAIFFLSLLFIACHQGVDFYETSSRPGGTNFGEPCKEGDENCDSPYLSFTEEDPNTGFFTEYFDISTRLDLEFFLVVDASSSMSPNLKKLGVNISSLLYHISAVNWRMAFINADHGDHNGLSRLTADKWQDYKGELPRFGQLMELEKEGRLLNQFVLQSGEKDYKKIFKDTLTRNKNGSCHLPPGCQGSTEQPLRSLKAALERYEAGEKHHKDFFRAHTDTVVIIITDEDERRGNEKQATTAEEVLQTYESVFKGQKKRLFGFSISIQGEKCYKKEARRGLFGSAAQYGQIIGRLADLTGGKNVSICEKDYGKSLKQVSQLTKELMHSIVLQKLFYIPDTVQVSFTPKRENIAWTLQGRRLVFSDPIPAGTQVKISYQYE